MIQANVLVHYDPDEERPRAMLCDFGLLTVANDPAFASMQTEGEWAGLMQWCSPELFDEEKYVRTCESDIWALGWLAWEVSIDTSISNRSLD